MAASTKRKTEISIRKDHDQREPAGRRMAGGTGDALCEAIVGVVTGRSSLGERQLARGRVIIENLGVASPLDGGFQLAARFVLAEVFVEKIAEEFVRESAVGFCSEGILHLRKKRDIGERRLAKNCFARLNVRLRVGLPLGSDDGEI